MHCQNSRHIHKIKVYSGRFISNAIVSEKRSSNRAYFDSNFPSLHLDKKFKVYKSVGSKVWVVVKRMLIVGDVIVPNSQIESHWFRISTRCNEIHPMLEIGISNKNWSTDYYRKFRHVFDNECSDCQRPSSFFHKGKIVHELLKNLNEKAVFSNIRI